ncbi:uncharacterized protein F4817DRAFT_352033 [Daldinia loculata]|uniref:uncharacterized protein n=1 Tax=Daldinia loculata TaxID=103429 RepID=UPI0020C5347A|nr:uncharacterized protein F4817DRAFT_352033 [Daldinia loculata]KAI1642761.1 hypothetical protein F4817DRAFT_352033 [Daldinia loculata]
MLITVGIVVVRMVLLLLMMMMMMIAAVMMVASKLMIPLAYSVYVCVCNLNRNANRGQCDNALCPVSRGPVPKRLKPPRSSLLLLLFSY